MRVAATPEGGYKTLSETTVHETVSNWITAGGRVGQQLDVRLGHAGQIASEKESESESRFVKKENDFKLIYLMSIKY